MLTLQSEMSQCISSAVDVLLHITDVLLHVFDVYYMVPQHDCIHNRLLLPSTFPGRNHVKEQDSDWNMQVGQQRWQL